MKIYGAGSIEDIKQCLKLGVSGILTNPQGFDQYFQGKMTLEEITKSICDITDLPVYIQIHGKDTDELVKRAEKLHKISSQVGFKIIADKKGFNAIYRLQKHNIDCIATSLFSLSQAAIAASVGAFGICPFVSRSLATGIDAGAVITAIKKSYAQLEKAPEIIAVSLKSPLDAEIAIKSGADAIGMRYPMMEQMMEHPLSTKAELLFAKNWVNVLGEDVSYTSNFSGLKGIAE
jgi:transaldolase